MTKKKMPGVPDLYRGRCLDPLAHVRYVADWAGWAWYVIECDGNGLCFGLVDGPELEVGYFRADDLELFAGPSGERIRRDSDFRPTPVSELLLGRDGLRHAAGPVRSGGESTRLTRKRLSRAEAQLRTKEHVLNSAAGLFVKRGIGNTSVDDIVASAGYTKGAFYANFRSKEDLFLTLIERHGHSAEEQRVEVLERTPQEAAIAAARAHLAERARRWDWLLLDVEFKLAAVRTPRLRRKLRAWHRERVGAAVASMHEFARLVDGDLPARPEAIALAIESMLGGLALLRALDPESVDDKTVQQVLDLLFVGMIEPRRTAPK